MVDVFWANDVAVRRAIAILILGFNEISIWDGQTKLQQPLRLRGISIMGGEFTAKSVAMNAKKYPTNPRFGFYMNFCGAIIFISKRFAADDTCSVIPL